MLRIAGRVAATAAGGGVVATGVYSNMEHEKQPIEGVLAQTAFWWATGKLGIPGTVFGQKDIPYRPDQLTPEALTVCLRETGVITAADTRVVSVSSQHFGDGDGFMSCMEKLTLEYEGSQAGPQAEAQAGWGGDGRLPATMIAKFAAGDFFAQFMCRFLRMLEAEAEVWLL